MATSVTLSRIYEELKVIEQNMVTKEEISSALETIEIMANEHTMEQIKRSEEDIKTGRIKEIKSVRDI